MNIIVTGAAGFIGSHLYTALSERGHTVTPIDKRHGQSTSDRDFLQWVVGDARPDVIAHLGASCSTSRSLTDPAYDFHHNAVGTFNIAEVARRFDGIPVVYTSTVKVHPGADGRIAPLGLSKRVGEDYLRLYRDLYGLPSVILRPSTVYGPGQDGSPEAGWVTWFLRAALEKRQITIHGDGTQSRDILHVDDMTALLVDIVENFDAYQGCTYEVGGGLDNEVTLRGLLAFLGHEDTVRAGRLPGDLQRVVTDNTPITAVRGWKPRTPWKDGVLATLDTMRRQS